ncbi:MAG: hypothetical protein AB2693_21015 [Candidatus Thiodiazotropha sp.]
MPLKSVVEYVTIPYTRLACLLFKNANRHTHLGYCRTRLATQNYKLSHIKAINIKQSISVQLKMCILVLTGKKYLNQLPALLGRYDTIQNLRIPRRLNMIRISPLSIIECIQLFKVQILDNR